MIKKIDWYIIKKFLGTFFLALALIIVIAVVFDISEKMDDFLERKAPLRAIVIDYYLNFIPYFANLFSPLFVFISVIFFTARLAANTEIVAILNSGVSFNRMLRPYFIGASFLAFLSFVLNSFIIPHANETRLAFENKYIKNPVEFRDRDLHRQLAPGIFMYLQSFNNRENAGLRFSLEKIVDGKRTWFLNSDRIVWDSLQQKWNIENYYIRTIGDETETLKSGAILDTTLPFTPADFKRRVNIIDAMDTPQLNAFIAEQKLQGVSNLNSYLIELYKRYSFPIATFILTLMGVSISSKKVRGGIGAQLGVGIFLSFTYILFMQVSTTFATSGNFPPLLAVWIPNIVFTFIAIYLYKKAPK
ncbi:MAG: hypothetical protein RIQ89_1651 [Bacteroidota bacterium]